MTTKTLAPGGGVQYWLADGSWLPAGVPGTGDDVVLSGGSAVALTGAAAVGSVTVNAGATLDLAPGAMLIATGGVVVNGGSFAVRGTLANTVLTILSGPVTGSGSLSNVTINGTDTLGAGSTLHLVGDTRFSNANEAGLVVTASSTTVEVPTATTPDGHVTTASVDGGLLIAGSADATAPTRFLLHGTPLYIGAQSLLDIVGQAEFDSGGPELGSTGVFVNQGTILVGNGARLALNDTLLNSGTVHIASGTLDASVVGSYGGSGTIAFDGAGGTLMVGNSGKYTVTGFSIGDKIALKGVPPEAVTSANYLVSSAGTTVSYGNLSILLSGRPGDTVYGLRSDGAGGSVLLTTSPSVAAPTYAVTAGSTGTTFTVTRSGDLSTAAVLSYAVVGSGTNPVVAADFAGNVLPSGAVTFADGVATATITLAGSGTGPATNQSFNLTVSGQGVPASTAAGTVAAVASVVVPPVVVPPVVIPPVVVPPVVVPPVTPPATPPIMTPPVVTPPVITPPPTPVSYGVIGFADATTGETGTHQLDAPGAGGPSYLQAQYIYAGSDSLALSTQQANVFVHSGSGTDAIAVSSGQNVLDGGLGSNFMTGGTGTDTFFTDARAPGVVWNTLINFHSGDQATLFGYTAGISSYHWEANVAGAQGSQGATLRANIVGGAGRTGDGIDASITFAGISVAQAQNLQIVTGTVAAGNYLFIYSP